jgi:hypothetical protein
MKIGILGLVTGAGLAWVAFSAMEKAKAAKVFAELQTSGALAAAELQEAAALALSSLEEAPDELEELETAAPIFSVPMVGESSSSRVFQVVPRFGS